MSMYPCLFGGGSTPATLITKSITQNGTYNAQDDNADGYSSVEVNVAGGSGPLFRPQYTETLIADNSSLGTTLDFTDDYHNYPIIKVVTINPSYSNREYSWYTDAGTIDNAFLYSSNAITFNEYNTTQYVTYTKVSNVQWSTNHRRNLLVKSVYGISFTNASVEKTVLYNREGIGSTATVINAPPGHTIYEYDLILQSSCTGNYDETQPCAAVFTGPTLFDDVQLQAIAFNKYDAKDYTWVYSDHIGVTGCSWFYVVGIKFKYNGGGQKKIVTDLIPTPATSESTEPFDNGYAYSQPCWHAFDKDTTTGWVSKSGNNEKIIGYKFNEAVVVNRVSMTNGADQSYAISQSPFVWYVEGSNDDGTTWVTITSCGHAWTGLNETCTVDFENNAAYKWWRLRIVKSGAAYTDYIVLREVGFYNVSYEPKQDNYIYNVNTAQINLGYTHKTNTKLVLTCEPIYRANYGVLIGARKNNYSNNALVFFETFNGYRYCYSRTGQEKQGDLYDSTGSMRPWYNEKVVITISGKVCSIYNPRTGETRIIEASSSTPNDGIAPLGLFCQNNTTTTDGWAAYDYGSMKFYGLEIYEDGTLLHNFIPAYNDNKYCIYDTVADEYKYDLSGHDYLRGYVS